MKNAAVAVAVFVLTGLLGDGSSRQASAQSATPATSPDRIRAATGKVDDALIRANARTSRDWPSHGLDYAETRFSRLTQVNADNVRALGLAWSYDLESTRGVEIGVLSCEMSIVFDSVRERSSDRASRQVRSMVAGPT